MAAGAVWRFGAFWLDVSNAQLWKEEQTLSLKPKALAMLRHLIEHAGQLVTKEALFQAVWPDTVVSEAVLTTCMREIRQVLGDEAKAPQFVETVHRRGYRFIAPLAATAPLVQSPKSKGQSLHSALRTPHSAIGMVGRETELEQLYGWLEKALSGERQLVFVTGEPGIGKTTLVEAFLQSLESKVQRLASGSQNVPLSTFQTLDPRRQTLDSSLWIGRGQCIEHYGAGEAYLPLLEALGRLCREPGGERLLELLGQSAPTWLVQMPAVLRAAELETLQRKTAGATRERMLRELSEAVEMLTAVQPLVLWLEDLHWSDYSTLEWLAYLARRREAARVLVIGAYRPVEAIVQQHPLRGVVQELQLHGQCVEVQLGFLSERAVAEYLAVRFCTIPSPLAEEGQDGGLSQQQLSRRPPHPSPLPRGERETTPPVAAFQRLARVIHQRTDGNPLFMVNVVDYLVAHGVLGQVDGQWALQGEVAAIETGVPESLQQMIERQLERLSGQERRMLAVASVAGAEFSAAAVAAGLKGEAEEIEEQCEALARREQFLRASGMSDWPDGTVAARYGFLHALYQEVLYERVPAGRRASLHRQIGERAEAAYGKRAGEIAAELAVHFERGREYRRAIRYLQQAAENAIRRSAYQEAISLLTRGLELLKALPDTPERTHQELTLQAALGQPSIAIKGYAAPEVEQVYTRARELCEQVGETSQLFPILFGLWLFAMTRSELWMAHERAEQLLRLAQSSRDPALLLEAHRAVGSSLYFLGEFAPAWGHLEQAMTLYNSQQHRSHAFRYGQDPGVACLTYAARTLWHLGYPDQALQRVHVALTLAQELSHPFDLAHALVFTAELHRFRREAQATQERAEALIALCTEQGFPFWLADGVILQGYALAEQGQAAEGIVQMRQGLAALRATGAELVTDCLGPLAQAYGKVGQAEEGLTVLAEALVLADKTGQRFYEAELYRLKGELTLAQSSVQRLESRITNPQSLIPNPQAEAEACFLKAIEIARQQQAKSWELRAVMSLSRLWQKQGKQEKARQMLAEIYGWFTEGFDTADLKEAKALLQELRENFREE